MGQNYFNSLPLRLQLQELGKCRFMERSEFADGCEYLKGKKNCHHRLWLTGSEPRP
jgi:ketol-acid reductoisomerase